MRPSIYFNRLSLTLLWSRPRASKDLNIVYCNDWDANRSLIFGRESEGCLGIYRNVCKELVRDGKESSITDSTKLIYEDFSKSKKELKQCKRENFSSPEEVETERFNKVRTRLKFKTFCLNNIKLIQLPIINWFLFARFITKTK